MFVVCCSLFIVRCSLFVARLSARAGTDGNDARLSARAGTDGNDEVGQEVGQVVGR